MRVTRTTQSNHFVDSDQDLDDNEQEHNKKNNGDCARKMGLTHLRATIVQAKQMVGQGK